MGLSWNGDPTSFRSFPWPSSLGTLRHGGAEFASRFGTSRAGTTVDVPCGFDVKRAPWKPWLHREWTFHIFGTIKGGVLLGHQILSIQKCHWELRCQILNSWKTCFLFDFTFSETPRQHFVFLIDRWSCSSNGEVLSFLETCLPCPDVHTHLPCVLKHSTRHCHAWRRTVQRMETLEA